jgi:hypothetical protein
MKIYFIGDSATASSFHDFISSTSISSTDSATTYSETPSKSLIISNYEFVETLPKAELIKERPVENSFNKRLRKEQWKITQQRHKKGRL